MRMDALIGLDIGTSAVKGMLLSADGAVLAVESGAFSYHDEGTVRYLDPDTFLTVCFDVLRRLSEKSGNYRVQAICPCCASGNLLLLDENDRPIAPIIGWQSTFDDVAYSQEEREAIYARVGWPALDGFPLTVLRHIKAHRSKWIKNAKMICMSAEYLNFALTGKFGISPSMGTPFYLMRQKDGCYDAATLADLSVREECLPPIMEKGTVLGTLKKDAAEKLHLPDHTAVVLGSFDHPAGATGVGVYERGEVLLSCGTSWVEFFPTASREEAIASGFLVDRYMLCGAPYCVMNSVTSLGEKIDALRKRLFGKIAFADFDKLLDAADPRAPYPHFRFDEDDAGRARDFAKEQAAYGIVASAAMLLRHNLAECEKTLFPVHSLKIIGGITNSAATLRIIADILDRKIRVVNGVSAGAAGAAMLAGIGIGLFADEKSAFAAMHFLQKEYAPKSDADKK